MSVKLPITARIATEIAYHEAIVREAYKDSVGVWTWGVGLTSATGHNVERYIGKEQTLEHCISVYVWALNNYADDVRSKFKDVELTEPQFAGALSFHWNTGAIRTASWVNSFLAGDIAKARLQIMDWKRPPEIVGRRRKERDLFFDGKWSNDGRVTEWTRVRPNGSIDWSRSRRIDITKEMAKAFGGAKPEPGPIAPPMFGAAEHFKQIRFHLEALEGLGNESR